ncbi:MAG: hypothetical protein LBK29_02320 [Oscillospiraceae bacterium]|jgi:hypothetical protein|nr:hypothetical protein [Oscillospiraceae bacterium]
MFGTSVLTKYRTSVMYDFSSVVKAVIFIVRARPGISPIHPYDYDAEEALPVQVNPQKLKRNRAEQKAIDLPLPPVDPKSVSYALVGGGKNKEEELTLDLEFDIYDEYNARTRNGAAPFAFSRTPLDFSLSLANENFVIIEKLFQYSNTQDYFALFRWGDIEFFGSITSVDCEYSCFSPYGEPLKAKVGVTIRHQSLGKSDGIEKSPGPDIFPLVWAGIEAYSSTEKKVTTAAKIADATDIEAVIPMFLKAVR